MNKWIPIYLRFNTYGQTVGVLTNCGITIDESGLHGCNNTHVAYLGNLYRQTDEILIDDEGNEYYVVEVIEGEHVNILTCDHSILDNPDLSEYIIHPESPSVRWQGVDDG